MGERLETREDWWVYLKRKARELGVSVRMMEHHGAPRVFPCVVSTRVVAVEPCGVVVFRHDTLAALYHTHLLKERAGLCVDNRSLLPML